MDNTHPARLGKCWLLVGAGSSSTLHVVSSSSYVVVPFTDHVPHRRSLRSESIHCSSSNSSSIASSCTWHRKAGDTRAGIVHGDLSFDLLASSRSLMVHSHTSWDGMGWAALLTQCVNVSIEIHWVTSAAHPIPSQRSVCVCVCVCECTIIGSFTLDAVCCVAVPCGAPQTPQHNALHRIRRERTFSRTARDLQTGAMYSTISCYHLAVK